MTEAQPAPDPPALRHLDVHRVEDGERTGVVVVDPLGLTEGQVFVPEGLLPIVGRFDGVRSIAAIERELSAELGEPVPDGFVRSVVEQLDEALLLRSPRLEAAIRDAAAAFAAVGVRRSPHAGRTAGYPDEPEACRAALAAILGEPNGDDATPLRGLVAPHIDLARGGDGYRAAYARLAASERADLYVVFGTGHHGPTSAVTGLALDWETPLGTLRTDREFVARVHRRLGAQDPVDVLLHRHEHSVEFQMLFLAHVLGPDVEVAGFLTGSLPEDRDARGLIVEAFADAARASGKRVCWIAGADLAHVGPFFGDPEPVGEAMLARLDRVEREKLALLREPDPDGFWHAVHADGNRDRICGAAPITLATMLAGGAAELLHYGQARAEDGSQVVTFASLAIG